MPIVVLVGMTIRRAARTDECTATTSILPIFNHATHAHISSPLRRAPQNQTLYASSNTRRPKRSGNGRNSAAPVHTHTERDIERCAHEQGGANTLFSGHSDARNRVGKSKCAVNRQSAFESVGTMNTSTRPRSTGSQAQTKSSTHTHEKER